MGVMQLGDIESIHVATYIEELSRARSWRNRSRTIGRLALPNVADQVVRTLRPRVLFGEVTLAAAARRLAMHPRALNRRLQAEGTTFRKLLNEARFEVAVQLLQGTRIGVTEIAAALSYADASAFTHAFRRMAGTSPLEWRSGGGIDPRAVARGELARPIPAW